MENNDNSLSPIINLCWLLLTGVFAVLSNFLHGIDLVLSIIAKLIPIISFVLFLLINHEAIVKNFKKVKSYFKWKK